MSRAGAIGRWLVLAVAAGLLAACAWGASVMAGWYREVPDVIAAVAHPAPQTTRIYAADGTLIDQLFVERRVSLPLSEIPRTLRDAVVAAEDAEFYLHPGISPYRIAVAAARNLLRGRVTQGASTITQQLVKNLLLTPERTARRKFQEAVLAVRLEAALGKDEILARYLNEIYFGHGVYGVHEAARRYFCKPPAELTVGEAAYLAGIPRSPTRYDLFVNPDASRQRQRYVLDRMLAGGFIDPLTHRTALEQALTVCRTARGARPPAAYYTARVAALVEAALGRQAVYEGGLRVDTPLDLEMQAVVDRAVVNHLFAMELKGGFRGPTVRLPADAQDRFRADGGQGEGWSALDAAGEGGDLWRTRREPLREDGWYHALVLGRGPDGIRVTTGKDERLIDREGFGWTGRAVDRIGTGDLLLVRPRGPGRADLGQLPQTQAAVVALDNRTGDVLALSGGLSFSLSEFDRALNAVRQPGSAFKPIVYAEALRRRLVTPASLIDDEPLSVVDPQTGREWKPDNYDHRYRGPVGLRVALADSINIPAVRLLLLTGAEPVARLARDLGVQAELYPGPALALGASGVPPIEMASAYATFAALGQRHTPRFFTSVAAPDGRTLIRNGMEGVPALEPAVAYLVTRLLSSVIREGTARKASGLPGELAGKTGTSNNYRDAWFIGYSPAVTVCVWAGRDDNRPMGRLDTGAGMALPIWIEVMGSYLRQHPPEPFPTPPGVVAVRLDPATLAPDPPPASPAVFEYFLAGTEPGVVPSAPDETFFRRGM